jgi:hypothetical protein
MPIEIIVRALDCIVRASGREDFGLELEVVKLNICLLYPGQCWYMFSQNRLNNVRHPLRRKGE